MSKIVSTNYEGKYKSTTSSPLNNEIPITVNARVFTPVDLLASAYGSCLLGTIDYEAQKRVFLRTNQEVKLNTKWEQEIKLLRSASNYSSKIVIMMSRKIL